MTEMKTLADSIFDAVKLYVDAQVKRQVDTRVESKFSEAIPKAQADILASLPVPRDGKDGKDGRDGVDLESFEFKSIDGGRVIRFEGKAGDVLVAHESKTGMPIDRGVFKAGTTYEAGDGVTYGGSWWLAQKDTSEAPGNGSTAWRLAVKRGKDAT